MTDEARVISCVMACYKSDNQYKPRRSLPQCSLPHFVKTNYALRQFNKLNYQFCYVVFPLLKKSLLRKSFSGTLFLKVAMRSIDGCGLSLATVVQRKGDQLIKNKFINNVVKNTPYSTTNNIIKLRLKNINHVNNFRATQ
jgi:hypothetical protein